MLHKGGATLGSKLLLLLVRDADMVKYKTHDAVAKLIAYIMDNLMSGTFPTLDPSGNRWAEGSREAERAGQLFAGGMCCAFSAFKGDLEARVLVHKLVRNWSSNSICEHCLAGRAADGFSYGDFSDRAAYMEFFLDHHQFLLLNPADRQSGWIEVKGWRKDRNLDDMLHCLHQGVAPIAIASLVTHHFEDSCIDPATTLAKLDRCLSTIAWPHYQRWKRAKNKVVVPTSSRFSAKSCNRERWVSFPELASVYKGAQVKYLIFWLRDFLLEKMEEEQTAGARTRAYCAYTLAEFQLLQEKNGAWLSPEVAQEMSHMARTFLLFYQKLAGDARRDHHDRRMYKLVPKFHSLLHVALDIPQTLRNPRYDHLYSDEDFMKQTSRIASRTHPSTMDKVTLYRYRALIELFDCFG